MNDKITPQKHQQQQQPSFPYTYLVHSNTLNQSREPITPRGEGISNNNNNNSKELPYQQPNYLWQTEERERDQQEYITFLNQRRPYSRNSDTASVQFLNDDRLNSTNKFGIQNNNIKGSERIKQFESKEPKELFAKDIAQIRVTKQLNNNQQMTSREEREWVGEEKRREENKRSNEVDYSSNDFRIARAAIEEAAARQQNIRGPPDRLRRVKRIGDTTIITEHRDPYSFYWQLDQLKNSEQEPERIPPPVDYVLEEEEEEEWITEEERLPQSQHTSQFLSPDSGVHLIPSNRGENEELEEEEEERGPPVYSPIRHIEDPTSFSHYWHVDSGPRLEEEIKPKREEKIKEKFEESKIPLKIISTCDIEQQTIKEEPIKQQPIIEEHAYKQTTTKKRVDLIEEKEENEEKIKNTKNLIIKSFNVYYLGNLELKESELNGIENSQTSLNNSIIRLRSENGNEAILSVLNDGIEVWSIEKRNGEGKREELIIKQPINRIRCWAVERENPNEFAFVSLEKGRLLCHVFRCNQPAKEIAEALSNICGTLLRQKNYSRPSSFNGSTGLRRITRQSTPILPSPIEEQKKIIRCHFIGVTQVPRATGIEMLNEAVDRLLKEVRKERWTFVDVHISPSTIIIFEAKGVQRQIASCRVRYLSFLGIGRDTKHCAFIVAQSTDHFICYVFHTEPSANSLAKTIEAACKLRYQKVLDAHLSSPNESLSRSMPILEEWSKNQRGINNTHF